MSVYLSITVSSLVEGLLSFWKKLYPEIFNKIIDSKCVEFFPYHEFYRLDRNEIKLVIEKIDEYLIKNTADSKAEFYAKDIWEKDLRNELIKNYLSN